MKKSVRVFALCAVLFSALPPLPAAVKSYDIGEDRTLYVYDDGRTEIVRAPVTIPDLSGAQYALDKNALLDAAVALMIAEEPDLASLDRESLRSLVESLLDAQEGAEIVFGFRLVIVSETAAVLACGDESASCSYRIDGERRIYIAGDDGSEEELGKFTEDYSHIIISGDQADVPFDFSLKRVD